MDSPDLLLAEAGENLAALLDGLDLPSDLVRFDTAELSVLASAIRSYLITSLSLTGGHLSPNLGVVELTLALHRSFDSPRDSFVWDVGHQTYVHKILTGRAGQFPQLRRDGGLSGYPSRAESEHDLVENSHASTSLSYGLGLALSKTEGHTVAIIGDGALTGGMAYEALNHIAQARPERLIVVLNDNGRSYAPTVGGLAQHLSRLRLDPHYESTKKAIGSLLSHLPLVGEQADETARRIKEAVKQVLSPSTFFDVLELKYAGPVDGHDTKLLEETFARAKEIHEPVVIHVVTEKGRGYQPAIEDERDRLHGVGGFDISTGAPTLHQGSYTDVFEAAMAAAAESHPDLVAVTAAMESSTGLETMAAKYPERVFDVGISEQHAVTFAAGLAMGGLRPVVCIYSSFLQRAIDQVMLDVAMHQQPVTFVLDRAGVTGPDGASHHGMFDLSYLRMIPNLAVAAAANEFDLCALLEAALSHDGPVAIRFPKGSVSAVPQMPVSPLAVGEWDVVDEGEDVLLLATGSMVEPATKAAAQLREQGVTATVVNARWIKPMDERLIEWVRAHNLVVTVEDNVRSGGFGAGVLEALAPAGLAGRVRTLAAPDSFLRFGSQQTILKELGLESGAIAAAVEGFLAES